MWSHINTNLNTIKQRHLKWKHLLFLNFSLQFTSFRRCWKRWQQNVNLIIIIFMTISPSCLYNLRPRYVSPHQPKLLIQQEIQTAWLVYLNLWDSILPIKLEIKALFWENGIVPGIEWLDIEINVMIRWLSSSEKNKNTINKKLKINKSWATYM